MYLYNNSFDFREVGNYILTTYFPDTPLRKETRTLFRDFLNGFFFKVLNPPNEDSDYGAEDSDTNLGRMLIDCIPLGPNEHITEIEAFDLDVNLFAETEDSEQIFFPVILVRIDYNGLGNNL